MIVILNGPAGCGKDTIADILHKEYDFLHHAMKTSLVVAAAAIAGIPIGQMHSLLHRNTKDNYNHYLGMSPRNWLIEVSENIIKPQFGSGFFGSREAIRCQREIAAGNQSIVYSDGGFPEELQAMATVLGEDNILLVRLRRDGYTFDGDSRNYLDPIGDMPYLDIKLETGKPERAVQDIMSVHIQMLYGEM